MQVTAHGDQSVKTLTTQSTGQGMLQLRASAGEYSARHLQQQQQRWRPLIRDILFYVVQRKKNLSYIIKTA